METIQLSDVALELESGGRPKGGASIDGILSIGGEHILENGSFNLEMKRFVPKQYYNAMNRGRIQYDDILIVKDGATTGKVAFVDSSLPLPVAVNEHVFRLAVDSSKLSPRYAFYHLLSPIGNKQILDDFRGATVGGISQEFPEKVRLPRRSLPEQKSIAAKLTQVDKMCRQLCRGLHMCDEFPNAAFHSIFGSEAECLTRWPWLPLDECCLRVTDGTHLTPKFQSTGVPFIFVKNIDNGRIDFSTDKFISEEIYKQLYGRCPVERGDILYSIVGATYGQAVAVGNFTKFAFQRHIAHLKPNNEIVLPKFLTSVMQFPLIKVQADRWARGAAQPTINLKELKEFKIPVPPRPLQEQFVALIDRHERLRIKQRESLRQADHLFQTLLHQAFSESQ
jgi:type I restriction enzyme, S subunit